MRFMILLKTTRALDSAAGNEDRARRAACERYEAELSQAGILLTSESLYPSDHGMTMSHRAGSLTIVDGPFRDLQHILAGFWLIQVKSKEEAVEWAKRFPLSNEQTQIELSPLTELSDFPELFEQTGGQELAPHCPTPDSAHAAAPEPVAPAANRDKSLRYLMMFKADAKSELGLPPDVKTFTEMGKLMGDMAAAGVGFSGDGLRPSRHHVRIALRNGQRSVTDGPFAETKELIAGYLLVQVASREEALSWASRGALINGDCESEIRQVR
ncbi:MAG: hypothetical protein JWN04_5858 [Myxococcaceae bacterium]|nr:hypothetical protein [Myxococcaceae bacterium]